MSMGISFMALFEEIFEDESTVILVEFPEEYDQKFETSVHGTAIFHFNRLSFFILKRSSFQSREKCWALNEREQTQNQTYLIYLRQKNMRLFIYENYVFKESPEEKF